MGMGGHAVNLELVAVSIGHLERRAVFRPRAAVIIDACRGDVRMPEPFLYLCDVCFMIEGIGGGCRAKRMRTDLEAELCGVDAHQLVDAVRRDRLVELAGSVVADRPE